jgi:histone deacetylase complex regulatory component SIN3
VTISYLHRVRLATALEIYAEFLTAMTDFKTGLADTVAIISRVRQQFSGHPHLVTGFHVFLPAGHKITRDGSMDLACQADIPANLRLGVSGAFVRKSWAVDLAQVDSSSAAV